MLNLRHKQEPQRIFRLQELNLNRNKVDYLGKPYVLIEIRSLHCKGLGFSRSTSFNLSEIDISHQDNPGTYPLKAVNVYRWQISHNRVMLYHCLAIFSKNKEGEGVGDIIGKTEVGTFNSIDVLRDFAKRHKLQLIN
jgi:hypothetical protein